jgi:hypothetical protein
MSAPSIPTLWMVHSPCGCEDPGCYGKTDIMVFTSKQTARQEADLRSQRYGGYTNRPDMHIDTIPISTKTSGY